MACGIAHQEDKEVIEYIACGLKYERKHGDHLCVDCSIRGSVTCQTRCWYGSECHFTQGGN